MFLSSGESHLPHITIETGLRVVLGLCKVGFSLHGLEALRLHDQLLVTVGYMYGKRLKNYLSCFDKQTPHPDHK